MPTYEYACKQCGEHLEIVQKFTDEPLTTCPSCTGPLRKVFGSIGISFKGSGFYKTDSRADNGAKKKDSEPASEGGGSKDGDAKPKTDAPAATAGGGGGGGKADSGTPSKGSSTAAAS